MLSLSELAQLSDCELQGDPHCHIAQIAPIAAAKQGAISFISETKYQSYLNNSNASAIILPPKMAHLFTGNKLLSRNPYLSYAKVATALFHPKNLQKQSILVPLLIQVPLLLSMFLLVQML